MFEVSRPLLTLGRRASRPAGRAELAETLQLCAERGIEVLDADRGGLATLHLPGQLVVFIALPAPHPPVRDVVCELLTGAAALADAAGVASTIDVDRDVGVWSAGGKVASVGLRIRDRVIRHGMSVNVAIDPEYAHGLRLCGGTARGYATLAGAVGCPAQAAERLAGHLGLVRARA